MYQFFVDRSEIDEKNNRVILCGENYNHLINVLRITKGEEFAVSNGEDMREYRCSLLSADGDVAVCEIRFIKESDIELPVKVHLYQGIPKGDKMELIIQKMVELGVYDITPVAMSRCIAKLDDKKEKNKISRWNAISEAAAKQSKRKIIPTVRNPLSFKEAIREASSSTVRLIPYELSEGMDRTRSILKSLKNEDEISFFIGPEGGISEEEIEYARAAGFEPVTLGKRILRTETAGLTLMAFIMYETEG